MESLRESLTKHTSDVVTIYPYRDVPDKEWPSYFNDEDKWVPYPAGWKNLGYELPYPTTSRLKRLGDLTRGLSINKKKVSIESGDPDKLSNYLVFRLIKGIRKWDPYKETSTKEDFDLEFKEWLEDEFNKSSFLCETLRTEYEKIGGKYMEEDDEEEETFTDPSENTSDD